jgi:GntR family transcriptional repressor for pyruvate dehydrogenase complex
MHAPSGKPQKLYQQIAETIAGSIKTGVYRRGERLPSERDLAEELKVSRPTIREAMIALEIRGLVEAHHGSGVYVTNRAEGIVAVETDPAPELDIGPFELTEARRIFEGETSALAASVIGEDEIRILEGLVARMEDPSSTEFDVNRADRQFHVAIAEATKNSAIVTVVESLWDMRHSSLLCRTMLERAAVRPVAAEHSAILNALKTRDPHRARRAMRSHLNHVIDALFKATELDSVERAKSVVEAKRSEFVKRSSY